MSSYLWHSHLTVRRWPPRALDHLTRIWDLPARRERYAITSMMNTYVSLAFSPDGRLLVLGDHVSPVVRLWDMTTGTERADLARSHGRRRWRGDQPRRHHIGRRRLSRLVTFWDLTTLKVRPRPLRHAGVHSLAFAPDGRALASGGFDGRIHLWAYPFGLGD